MDDPAIVTHFGHPVVVHPVTAEAYGIRGGECIGDRELRALVHCTQMVGWAEFRFLSIIGQMPKLRPLPTRSRGARYE